MTIQSLNKIAVGLFFGALTLGGSIAQENGESARAVKAFLRNYINDPGNRTTQFSYAPVSLGDKKQEIFVYLTGPDWCGSGGCTALLLAPVGSSFRVIDKFTLVWLPIRILTSKTNGLNDIALRVRGGGILPGYTAILRFDGRRYPANPSLAPQLPAEQAGTGKTVPLKEHGAPLY